MHSRILVVGRDVALRARLARMLHGGGYQVDIAESDTQVRQIGLKGISLVIVDRAGLGPAGARLMEGLRAAAAKFLVIAGPGSAQGPGSDAVDAADESGLLARVAEALQPAPEADEAAPAVVCFAEYTLDLGGQSCGTGRGTRLPLHVASSDCCKNSCVDPDACCREINCCRRWLDTTPSHSTVALTCLSCACGGRLSRTQSGLA